MICIRLLLGAVLAYSAYAKLQAPLNFLNAVYQYEMVGPTLGWWIAATIPYIELLAGISLLTGLLSFAGSWIAAGLGLLFIIAQLWAISHGLLIDCGCFGSPGGGTAEAGDVDGLGTLLRAVGIASTGALIGSSNWLRLSKNSLAVSVNSERTPTPQAL